MSNEMSLFSNGAAIPAHLQRREVNEATKALMGGSGGRRLSIRGNIFRMIVGGQEVAKNDARAMNIVIVAASPATARNFYIGTYQEGVATPPDCWSADGITPSPLSTTIQATACATCPQNIGGSGQGDSRACRYSHRLAIVLENDIFSSDVYELSLAATSLFGKGESGKMPLMQYAKLLGSHGMNVTDVVTEIRFDTDSATPRMIFRAVRPLTVEEMAEVAELGQSPDAKLAISMDYSGATASQSTAPKEPLFAPVVAVAPVVKPIKEKPSPALSEVAAPIIIPKKAVVEETEMAADTDMDSLLAEWAD